jgi:hypothetical protein|tara:strand:- start:926 stop:1072 length:147 start_codon:yes stop_codon:yes gene_type:complete
METGYCQDMNNPGLDKGIFQLSIYGGFIPKNQRRQKTGNITIGFSGKD